MCLQCRPEYKVPGLYVVDSIIRQSRHQFGPEKDVYGPRFMRNIVVLFHSLLSCPSDDIVCDFVVYHINFYISCQHLLFISNSW